MTKPKVSVIIPVYNVEKYLKECLESIVNQTLSEIEIICIDDGSKDSSSKILDEYAKKDDRIKILPQENFGAAIARNNGMSVAKGEYLAFLDADDFFELDMLEKAYLQSKRDNADICVFRSNCYNVQRKKYENIPCTIKQKYLPDVIPFASEEIFSNVFQIFNGWAWDKLYRRKFVQQTNLKFQSIRTTNDAFFVFMTIVQAESITILDDVLAHHRINTKTSLTDTSAESWNCWWKAVEKIKQELYDRDQYKLVEQSFINWTLHILLWDVHTLEDNIKAKLLTELKEKYFLELGFDKYPKEYFYNQSEYREYLQIMCKGTISNANKYLLRRILQHLKDNGIKATLGKIIKKMV